MFPTSFDFFSLPILYQESRPFKVVPVRFGPGNRRRRQSIERGVILAATPYLRDQRQTREARDCLLRALENENLAPHSGNGAMGFTGDALEGCFALW